MSSDRSPACDAAEAAVAQVLAGLSPDDAVRVITQVVRDLPAPAAGCPGGTTGTTAALLDLGAAVQAATLAHVAVLDAEHALDTSPSLTARSWLRQTGRLSDREAGTVVSLARRLHTDPWRALPAVAAAVAAGDMTPSQAQAVATATRRAPVEVVPAVDEAVVTTGAHLLPDELGRHVAAVVDRLATQAAPLLGPGDPGQERFLRVQRRHDALTTLAGLFTTAALHQAVTGADTEVVVPRPRATVEVVLDLDRVADLLTGQPRHPDRLGHPQAATALRLPGTIARTPDGVPLGGPATEHLSCDPMLTWTLIQTLDPPPDLPPDPAPDHLGPSTCRDPDLATAVRAALMTISPALGGIPVAVIDAARLQRLGSPIQRRKATLRDRGCVVPGCTVPAWLCEPHRAG